MSYTSPPRFGGLKMIAGFSLGYLSGSSLLDMSTHSLPSLEEVCRSANEPTKSEEVKI